MELDHVNDLSWELPGCLREVLESYRQTQLPDFAHVLGCLREVLQSYQTHVLHLDFP